MSKKITIVFGASEKSAFVEPGETLKDALNDPQIKRALALPADFRSIRVSNQEGEVLSLSTLPAAGAVYTVTKLGNDKGATVTFVHGASEYTYNMLPSETFSTALNDKQVRRALSLSDTQSLRIADSTGVVHSLSSKLTAGAVYTLTRLGNDKGEPNQ